MEQKWPPDIHEEEFYKPHFLLTILKLYLGLLVFLYRDRTAGLDDFECKVCVSRCCVLTTYCAPVTLPLQGFVND